MSPGDVVSNTLAALRAQLKAAHLASGELSTREISRRSHGAVSHTTAHQVLRAATLPSWRTLEPVVDALGANLEEFKKLWIRARSDEERAEVGTAAGNAYREDVSTSLAAALNLFRQYCSRKEEEKAKAFLISRIGTRADENIELVIELYDRFYYKDEEISAHYDPVIQSFEKFGDPEELEIAKSAHKLARRCLERGNAQRALAFAQRAVLRNPFWYGHFSIHAEVLISLGLYVEAEVAATAAHELEAGFTLFSYSPLADVLKFNRDYKRLEQLTKESYENSGGPGGSESANYAECLMLCGKTEDAISILKEGLAAGKVSEWERTELLIFTARAMCQQGSYSSARSILRSDELYATDKGLQLEFANVLAREGKVGESFNLLETLHDMPNEP